MQKISLAILFLLLTNVLVKAQDLSLFENSGSCKVAIPCLSGCCCRRTMILQKNIRLYYSCMGEERVELIMKSN